MKWILQIILLWCGWFRPVTPTTRPALQLSLRGQYLLSIKQGWPIPPLFGTNGPTPPTPSQGRCISLWFDLLQVHGIGIASLLASSLLTCPCTVLYHSSLPGLICSHWIQLFLYGAYRVAVPWLTHRLLILLRVTTRSSSWIWGTVMLGNLMMTWALLADHLRRLMLPYLVPLMIGKRAPMLMMTCLFQFVVVIPHLVLWVERSKGAANRCKIPMVCGVTLRKMPLLLVSQRRTVEMQWFYMSSK